MANLTDIAIRNAKPKAKPYTLAGGGGLTLLVMPSGSKRWRLRYRFAGKARWLTMGKPYPETNLAAAKAEADRARSLLAQGIDPAEQRRLAELTARQRAASTFADAANDWHAFHTAAWSVRTAAQAREYLDKDMLPVLGKRPLDNITTLELAALARKIEQRGAPNVASKVRQWLRSIFSYARANGWTENDPIRDLRSVVLPKKGGSNYPHLPLDELPDFLQALDAADSSPIVKGAVRMALWTANRPGVTRTLRWAELDLDDSLWSIERGREGMKRGYRHMTPLPRQAVEMLRELHKLTGSFEHVFIGRNNPRTSISDGAVNGLLKRLGFRGKQTMHGFRHLLSTALNEMGYDPDWVERQLGHGDPDKIRGIYNKAMYLEPRRKMMQDWADHLDELRTGKAPQTGSVRKLRVV